MTAIYIHKGEYGHGEASHALIRACAEDFCAENGIARTSFEIVTAENGKPFFADGPGDGHIEFSVSNSGEYWVCAVSTEPCGVDVQVEEDRDTGAIARRFFKPGELEYMENAGAGAVWRIWTRREALAKLSGRGIFGRIGPVADTRGRLKKSVIENGRAAYFHDLEPEAGAHLSLCGFDSAEPLIKSLPAAAENNGSRGAIVI